MGLKLGCEGKGWEAEGRAGSRGQSGGRRSPRGQRGVALLGGVIIIPHIEVTCLLGWRLEAPSAWVGGKPPASAPSASFTLPYLPLLQERGPLPGPKTGLLSNTRK